MVQLRNGTPEHRMEYHLLLSDLVPFDQNNCHLHRYHQFCHLHWHHHGSLSQRACSGFTRIRFLDQIKCESLHLRKSLTVSPHSNHHIHCFNATDILFTCSDCLAFIHVRQKTLLCVRIWPFVGVSAEMNGNSLQRKMRSANLIFAWTEQVSHAKPFNYHSKTEV